MNLSKSLLLKICILIGLFFSTQVSFASEPEQLPIPPVDSPDPGNIKPSSFHLATASATISDAELVVYFDFSVGNVLITVTDENNQPVFQDVVNTELMSDEIVPIQNWPSGVYTLTVIYRSTTQRGTFQIK